MLQGVGPHGGLSMTGTFGRADGEVVTLVPRTSPEYGFEPWLLGKFPRTESQLPHSGIVPPETYACPWRYAKKAARSVLRAVLWKYHFTDTDTVGKLSVFAVFEAYRRTGRML